MGFERERKKLPELIRCWCLFLFFGAAGGDLFCLFWAQAWGWLAGSAKAGAESSAPVSQMKLRTCLF